MFFLVDKKGVQIRSDQLVAIFGFDGNCKEEIRENEGEMHGDNTVTSDRFG